MNTRLSIIGGVVLAATVMNTGFRAESPPGPLEPDQNQARQTGERQDSQKRESSSPKVRLPFWKDPAIIKEVGLTSEQAKQIDKLWIDRLEEMVGRVEELHKQEAELERLVVGRTESADVVALQIDRVEAQRTMLYKSRAVMLYRMSLVLTPDQNKAMQAIWERLFGFSSGRGRSESRGR